MDDEKLYQVALSMVPGIGDISSKTLLSYCGSAKAIFKKNKSSLSKIPGIGFINAEKILSFNNFTTAESEIEKCIKSEIEILFCTDKKYPKKLKHAPDSPIILYYKELYLLDQNRKRSRRLPKIHQSISEKNRELHVPENRKRLTR